MRIATNLWAAVLGLGMTTAAGAATVPGEWLVRTSPDAADADAETLSAQLGVAVDAAEAVAPQVYKIKVNPLVPASFLKSSAKASHGAIAAVQPNFVYSIDLQGRQALAAKATALAAAFAAEPDNPAIGAPNPNPSRGQDPRLANQWGAAKARAKEAWATQRGAKDFVVAVLDTGVDYNHEDLRNAMWRNPGEIPGNGIDDDGNGLVDDVVGWDFKDNDAFPFDKKGASVLTGGNPGHGTHCAGVIGAVGDNGLGISGVAPNISVMALRFIGDDGQGTTADAVKAINYAVSMGVKVISNSWGGEKDDEDDTELRNAIANAEAKGTLLIFAAGNGRNGVGYDNDRDAKPVIPASYDNDNIIAVAAIDVNEGLGAFSNWGAKSVDIGAPGVKILSSVPGGKYEDQISIFGFPIADWSGTSMAAPHVAGAAALVWSQHPEASAAEVKAKILGTASPIASLRGKVLTGGMLNAAEAVK